MTDVDTLDYVLGQLDARRGHWPEVAEKSGVPYHTLTKIAQRRNTNPGIRTVRKLAEYFRAEQAPREEARA